MRVPLKVAAAVVAFLGAVVALAVDPLEIEMVLGCIAGAIGLSSLADILP